MIRVWVGAALVATVACGGETRPTGPTDRDDRAGPAEPTLDRAARELDEISTTDAAPPAPPTLQAALADLTDAGYPALAEIIAGRVAQRAPKMKLDNEQGRRAARALSGQLARSESLRALAPVMPKSTVELARAVAERDLPPADADAIARYLTRLTEALDFARLDRFDANHAHVTGRRWPEIDYSGEAMTWQGQRDYWTRKGVPDFRSARAIDAYMRHAYRLPHFARVYRPRGSLRGLARPPSGG